MLFTDDGWIAGRGKAKTDVYLFGYGLNYRDALKTFFNVSGRPPLVPRWSLGNWWSRYCEHIRSLSSIRDATGLTHRCLLGQGIPRSDGSFP